MGHDDDVAVTAEKLTTVMKAANVDFEPFWPSLFAKALEGRNIGDLICNVGAAPAVGGGGAAAEETKEEEKKEEKKEESEEESDDDMGFGLSTKGLVQQMEWIAVSSQKYHK